MSKKWARLAIDPPNYLKAKKGTAAAGVSGPVPTAHAAAGHLVV